MSNFRSLTSDEHEAVTRYALDQFAINPNADWKARLRKKWTGGNAKGVLLSLMITHGLDWLDQYSLSDWPMERFRNPADSN